MNTNHTFKRLCAVAIAVFVLGLTAKGESALAVKFPESGLVGTWDVTYKPLGGGVGTVSFNNMAGKYEITNAQYINIKYGSGPKQKTSGRLKPSLEGGYEATLTTYNNKQDVLRFTAENGNLTILIPSQRGVVGTGIRSGTNSTVAGRTPGLGQPFTEAGFAGKWNVKMVNRYGTLTTGSLSGTYIITNAKSLSVVFSDGSRATGVITEKDGKFSTILVVRFAISVTPLSEGMTMFAGLSR